MTHFQAVGGYNAGDTSKTKGRFTATSPYPLKRKGTDKNMSDNERKPGTFLPGNKVAAGRKTLRKTARELFRKDLPKAIETLRAMLNDDSEKPEVRLQAARLVLEYALGKPTQRTEIAADEGVGEVFRVILAGDVGDPLAKPPLGL